MISRCPQCNYSLTGLPEEHQCPECGLGYDAASEVYRHTSPRWLLFWGLCSCVAFISTMERILDGSSTNDAWPWLSILLTVFLAGVNAIGAYGYIQAYRYGALVAVLPDGLYLRLQGDSGSMTAWTDILGAVPDRRGKRLTVRIKGQLTHTQIAGVFKAKADALRLAQQIEQRKRQCCGAGHDTEAGKP